MVTPRAFRAGPVRVLRGPTPGRAVLAVLLALPLLLPMASPGRGEGAADPAKVMEAIIAQRKAQAEREDRDFQRFLDQARALLAEHSYDQAKRVLAQAARLRPSDDTCARLLGQAEAGNPAKASSERLIERLKDEQRSKNAILQVQLDNSLFDARKALSAGDHARAIEHAERVLDSASCVTDAARAAKLSGDAEAVLAAARAASGQAKAAELQAAVAEHKARAAKDASASLLDLNRQGWDHVRKGDGAKALAIADDMQRIEPGNHQAAYLRLEAHRLVGSGADEAKMKAERKEGERKLLENLDAEFNDLRDAKAKIVLPGKRRPGDFVARDERPMEAWEQQYRAKLRQRVEASPRPPTPCATTPSSSPPPAASSTSRSPGTTTSAASSSPPGASARPSTAARRPTTRAAALARPSRPAGPPSARKRPPWCPRTPWARPGCASSATPWRPTPGKSRTRTW